MLTYIIIPVIRIQLNSNTCLTKSDVSIDFQYNAWGINSYASSKFQNRSLLNINKAILYMMTVDTTQQKQSSSLSDLTVLKRSGNSEKFSQEKLVRGITRAGTPFVLANDISKSITSKLAENPPIDNLIFSSKLREYVSLELKKRNQSTIAESYLGYSKNSITSINEEQLKTSNNKKV